MKDQIRHIHFVGIGGVGMAGIAEVCLSQGYPVSGSDIRMNPTVQRLIDLGADIHIGHSEENVRKSDVVVISTAIPEDNPEVVFARNERVPVIPRAAMLAELMRMRFGIAIAGTHGKTTTTSLAAAILTEGGVDPTFVIGGKLNQVDSNAKLGTSEYLVAEADESDASFLHLSPMMAVVTNIDEDHMETYQGDYQQLENTFVEFIHRLPFYGIAILCADDLNIQQMMPKLSRKFLTYGVDESADIQAFDIKPNGLQMEFMVRVNGDEVFPCVLNHPGHHNVLNALAAIGIAIELGVEPKAIQTALRHFGGVGRRFEVYPDRMIAGHKVTLIDDYGHHPTELNATIDATRAAFADKRIVLLFQPHRYSRTRDLFDEFVQSLSKPDLVVLTDVYPAGETPITAYDSKALLDSLRMRGIKDNTYVDKRESLDELMAGLLNNDDVLLVMGAGDIGQIAKEWKKHG